MSTTTLILTSPYAVALGACVLLYFVVYPAIVYFRDTNGQCFPLLHPALVVCRQTFGYTPVYVSRTLTD
jgi:hypothetical protein